MQPSPNVAFCPVCRTPKRPNEVTCSQCGTRSCPNGHIIDSRICRQCGFEDRSWKPQAKAPSLEATVQRSHGIPEVKETVCPRCMIKTIFTYGRCHNCGFILESRQYEETRQEAARSSPGSGSQLPQSPSQYIVQQQFPGTYDAKLTYICSKCGSKADPRTGQCQTCGYIGSLVYEMPGQRASSSPPPPEQAKAPMKPQGFAGQQFSHPQETVRTCPSCSAPVPYDSRYCRQCGLYTGPGRHTGVQGYTMGAAEKVRGGTTSPGIRPQAAPSMPAMAAGGGMVQNVVSDYVPEVGQIQDLEREYPEKKDRVKEKKERKEKGYPREGRGFPTGLLAAVFVVAAALVAMIVFVVIQILAPSAPNLPTSTIDKIPPEISGVSVPNVTTTSVTIKWTTNEKATSQIMLCDADGVSCTYTEPDATLVTNHSVVLDIKKLNIKLDTKYHITVKSQDASGNEGTYEMEQIFSLTSQTPPDNTPVGINKGNKAPDFTLKNLQGTDVKLSSYRGKLVLVNFWRVDCGPCLAEMPHIQSVSATYRTKPLVVLAVNLSAVSGWRQEDTTIVQPFMDTNHYTFPVLLDTNGEVKAKYSIISSWPQTFFIDSTGIIRNIKVGAFTSQEEITSILNTMK